MVTSLVSWTVNIISKLKVPLKESRGRKLLDVFLFTWNPRKIPRSPNQEHPQLNPARLLATWTSYCCFGWPEYISEWETGEGRWGAQGIEDSQALISSSFYFSLNLITDAISDHSLKSFVGMLAFVLTPWLSPRYHVLFCFGMLCLPHLQRGIFSTSSLAYNVEWLPGTWLTMNRNKYIGFTFSKSCLPNSFQANLIYAMEWTSYSLLIVPTMIWDTKAAVCDKIL